MKALRYTIIGSLSVFILMGIISIFSTESVTAQNHVTTSDDTVFIIDQMGIKWDVTQAETLGFKPEKFQYGIGKNAFTTLDDSHISSHSIRPHINQRVIGIERENEAHAYSVGKLRYHEIANTHINGDPIAAGY